MRREFIAFVGGVAISWPLAVRAQQADRMRRIGVLMSYAESDPAAQSDFATFRDGLTKLALARETRTIPIVFAVVSDPIGGRLAASLARPGGNIIGFTYVDLAAGGNGWNF